MAGGGGRSVAELDKEQLLGQPVVAHPEHVKKGCPLTSDAGGHWQPRSTPRFASGCGCIERQSHSRSLLKRSPSNGCGALFDARDFRPMSPPQFFQQEVRVAGGSCSRRKLGPASGTMSLSRASWASLLFQAFCVPCLRVGGGPQAGRGRARREASATHCCVSPPTGNGAAF